MTDILRRFALFLTRRPLWLMRIGIGVVCVIVLGLMWRDQLVTRHEVETAALERIRARAAVNVRAAADSIQATLDGFNFALRAARAAVIEGPQALNMMGHVVIDSMPADLVIQIFQIDASGHLAYSSLGPAPRNYLGDRGYFRELEAASDDPLVVSDLVLGRLSNKWSIQFARRVQSNNAGFMGVVSLAVSSEAWMKRLNALRVDEHDIFALLSADGDYLLRIPYVEGYEGKKVPDNRPFIRKPEQINGDFIETGKLDGVERLFSWIRLPSGLVMATGVDLADAMAPMRDLVERSRLRTLLFSSLLVLVSAALAWALSRYEKVALRSQLREEHYRSVVENMGEGLMVVDGASRIIGINPAFTTLTGYGAEEVVGRNPALLSPTAPGVRGLGDLVVRHDNGSWEGDFDGMRWNGERYTGRAVLSIVRRNDKQPANRIVLIADVTEKRRKDEEVWRQANFDNLTGLPNRALMMDRFERMLSHARRQQSLVTVLFVDLDRFKPVNDNFGHEVGDRVLCEVARRLEAVFRDEDTVARLGGDEFVVLLPRNLDEAAVEAVAKKVVERLSQPFIIDDHDVSISCCVGIARFPDDGESATALLHRADIAMYRAKDCGRQTWSR